MIKVKVLKETKFDGCDSKLEKNSIVELDEVQGQKALENQEVELYTEEIEKMEKQIAIKHVKEINKMSDNIVVEKVETDAQKRIKDEKHVIGKAFRYIALKNPETKELMEQRWGSKAIAGMSEGTAADGGDLVTEAVSQIMGKVYAESEFLNGVTQLSLPDQANSMKVTYETSDWFTLATAPAFTIATEGAAKTPTKLSFGTVEVYPRVPNCLMVATDELMEDIAGFDGEVIRIMTMKLRKIIEALSFTGTSASGAQGFAGILDASSSGQVATQTFASLAAPTLAELQGFPAKTIPQFRAGSKWFMSNSFWQALQGSSALVSAANIDKMIIDYGNQKLLGYPVVIVESLASSAPVVFGNPVNFTLVNGRGGQVLLFSRELYFATDQVAWRLTKRVGGCVSAAKYTLTDASTVAPFVKASVQGS